MTTATIACYFCKTIQARPVDAQQDDICGRCLHESRVSAGVLENKSPRICPVELLGFRALLGGGPRVRHVASGAPTSAERLGRIAGSGGYARAWRLAR